MKMYKNLILYLLIPLTLVYIAFKIDRSNSANVYYIQHSADDGAEVLAIKKLSELVEKNLLDREYYETVACSDIGMRWYANYNKEQQALLITGNPSSGWTWSFYATPQQLKMIADKNIPGTKLYKYLRPVVWKQGIKFPTRSGI